MNSPCLNIKYTTVKRSKKPLFDVDSLIDENLLTSDNSKPPTKSLLANLLDLGPDDNENQDADIDDVKTLHVRFKPVHSVINTLRNVFSEQTSNDEDRISTEKSIESPKFTQTFKKSSLKPSNATFYNVDNVLEETENPIPELKSKKAIKYPAKSAEDKITNIDSLIDDIDENFEHKKLVLHKKAIADLSSSASSLSLSDENDIPNESVNTRMKKSKYMNTSRRINVDELLHVSDSPQNAKLTLNEDMSFVESDVKKGGTEWLREINQKLHETIHMDPLDTTTNMNSKIDETTTKKTSPSLLTVNTSNLYLNESDLKKRKLKFVKNGYAERLQKILIRQASSINFIKHQQITNEKCMLKSRCAPISLFSDVYLNSGGLEPSF